MPPTVMEKKSILLYFSLVFISPGIFLLVLAFTLFFILSFNSFILSVISFSWPLVHYPDLRSKDLPLSVAGSFSTSQAIRFDS